MPKKDDPPASLVPETTVDHASQRIFAVSLFVLIQCWKVYDIVLIRAESLTTLAALTSLNNFTFVLKYVVIDGVFLWLMPIFAIPYLTFLPVVTLLLTVVVNILTFVLASNATIPLFANLILPLWKIVFNKRELTIIGDTIKPHAVVDMNAHFKGRYTIHYLPDSSAKFNPFAFSGLCLDQGLLVYLPIEFNTTTDIGFLQLQHTDPQNRVNYLNYTKSEVRSLLRRDTSHLRRYPGYVTDDHRVFYSEIPLSKPGKYRIARVTDTKGTSIRSYKSEFVVGECPNAEFVYPVLTGKSYKCLGDDDDFNLPLVKVLGITPLTVELAAVVRGTVHKFNRTIEASDKASPVAVEQVSRNLLEQEILKNPSRFDASASYTLEFHLLSVTDSLQNSKRYNPASKDKDVWHELGLKKVPQIRLSANSQPLLINGTKTLFVESPMVDADFPLDVDVQYVTNDPLLEHNTTYHFASRAHLAKGFEVKRPGTYRILAASNKYCPCHVSEHPVNVEVVAPPSASIAAEPIEDKCIGMVGYKFDLKFSGAAPFHILYQVSKKLANGSLRPVLNEHGRLVRVIKAIGTTHNFEYRPPAEGEYVVSFLNVRDFNYREPITLEHQTYLTHFKKRSSATLDVSKTISLCCNESATIPVTFSGNGPFSFEYQILSGSKVVATEKVSQWTESVYHITTPAFAEGGDFKVKLARVQDSLGCDADFANHAVTIRSRADVPELRFRSESHIELVEGDVATIPLHLDSSSGVGNDVLRYTYQGQPLVSKSLKHLQVKDAGTYELVSFTNNGCAGKVAAGQTVTVSYLPKPNVTIVADPLIVASTNANAHDVQLQLKPVCQGRTNKVKLQLEGAKPFIVDYTITDPQGASHTRSLTIDSHSYVLDLAGESSGRFDLQLKSVYDTRYTRAKFIGSPTYQRLASSVKYDIIGKPQVAFPQKHLFTQICETNLKQNGLQAIPIDFTGEYPFTVHGTIRRGLDGKPREFTVADVHEPFIDLSRATFKKAFSVNTLAVGEHLLTIHSVEDGNGCTSTKLSSRNNYVIGVTEAPDMAKLDAKPHYCVGDHIAYNITGVAPFTVFYSFNGKAQKAELSNKFYRLASKPGELTIGALLDSLSNQCIVNFTQNAAKFNSLKLQVHDLPSVEVSQGENIITNIHEGDQTEITFSFTGVPPFYLKYVRTSQEVDPRYKYRKNADKHLRTVTEVKEVHDITDHEYTVVASLEGTYEAIEIRDRYCGARRT